MWTEAYITELELFVVDLHLIRFQLPVNLIGFSNGSFDVPFNR
jgi:hypothetical protein